MKRKLIGVILMAVMVCSLAACGSKETKETKADADKSGTPVLRVAMECGYAPYNWTQSDDSNGAVPIEDSKDYAYGYDVMMAKKIADKLGCELQIVKLDWDSLIPAVQSGTVDCVIAGQSITSVLSGYSLRCCCCSSYYCYCCFCCYHRIYFLLLQTS